MNKTEYDQVMKDILDIDNDADDANLDLAMEFARNQAEEHGMAVRMVLSCLVLEPGNEGCMAIGIMVNPIYSELTELLQSDRIEFVQLESGKVLGFDPDGKEKGKVYNQSAAEILLERCPIGDILVADGVYGYVIMMDKECLGSIFRDQNEMIAWMANEMSERCTNPDGSLDQKKAMELIDKMIKSLEE